MSATISRWQGEASIDFVCDFLLRRVDPYGTFRLRIMGQFHLGGACRCHVGNRSVGRIAAGFLEPAWLHAACFMHMFPPSWLSSKGRTEERSGPTTLCRIVGDCGERRKTAGRMGEGCCGLTHAESANKWLCSWKAPTRQREFGEVTRSAFQSTPIAPIFGLGCSNNTQFPSEPFVFSNQSRPWTNPHEPPKGGSSTHPRPCANPRGKLALHTRQMGRQRTLRRKAPICGMI